MSMTRIVSSAVLLLWIGGCDRGPAAADSTTRAVPPSTARAERERAGSELPPTEPAASDRPAILVYEDSHGRRPDAPGRRKAVEAAVWADGRIAWRAGDAMRQARIDPADVHALLERLLRNGAFGDGKVDLVHFGPDSGFEVIEVRHAGRVLRMRSWHELFERNPNLVVTSAGVGSLEGRDRDAVLAAEPPEYRQFRRTWFDIRSAVRSWVPSDGQPFDGDIPIDGRFD